MSNFKIWVISGIILTFVAGFLLGIIVNRSAILRKRHKHKEWTSQEVLYERLLARLSRKLDLTQPQIQAIGGILRMQASKINEARNDFHSKLKGVKEEIFRNITPHLTQEQLEKYQKLIESHRQRWEKICKSG